MITKILPVFIYPLGLGLILGVSAAVILLFNKNRIALVLILSSSILLWACSIPYFSNFILASLENRYPPVTSEELPAVDAIVVLGGSIATALQNDIKRLNMGIAIDRIFFAMDLYEQGKAPLLILSGGSANEIVPEAEIMQLLLKKYSNKEPNIILDQNSRNTYENAVNVLEIARENNLQKLILVTSASHMRRAVATFKTLGMEVTPAPTDFNVQYPEYEVLNWLPDAASSYRTTVSIKEYIGWWFYKITGKIKV